MAERNRNVTTPAALASYPFLAEPTTNQKGEEVYSIALIFPPGSELKEIQDAILEAGTKKFGKDKVAKALRSGPYSNPLRKLDDEECTEKGYPIGSHIMRSKSKVRPGVVTRQKGSDGKPIKLDVDDYGRVYPGSLVRASINFYGYDNESKGVGCGLNGVQLWDETTPRIDGRQDASELFDADLEDDGSDPFAK